MSEASAPGSPKLTARALARYVESLSWAFAVLGVVLPFAIVSPVFAPYRLALAEWAYGGPAIPPSDERLLALMAGITGGSIAGKYVVHALIARGPLAEGKLWARDLTLRGLALWFAVDSLCSVGLGASFNVYMVNLLPVLVLGLPLVAARSAFEEDPGAKPDLLGTEARGEKATRSRSGAATALRVCFWTSAFGAAAGAMIAAGGQSALFAPWWAGLAEAHYAGGPIPEGARRLALFFFGPVGGCALAQFTMLTGLIAREGATRRVALAGSASIAVWFAIDSAYGLANAGLFNILVINVPSMLLTLPPYLWLSRTLAAR